MRILGIDPGLNTCGYACMEVSGLNETLIEAGFVRTKPSMSLSEKLLHIGRDMDELLDRLGPAAVAVEQLYAHYAHPRTAILMGHARGVILQKCAEREMTIKEFSATKIKKAVTGNGHASKQQMQRTIQTLLGLKEIPEPNDVADAIAAALCCGASLKIDCLSVAR